MMLTEARDAIVVTGRRMVWDKLVVGTAGNLSVRSGSLVAVTPTGVPYDQLTAGAVGVVDLAGVAIEGPLPATSELPLHLAVYSASPAAAIVHTHSVAATALSCLVSEVPAVHYYAALFGGAPRVAPYSEYGTAELAAGAVAALDGRSACLLANHGAVTIGDSLAEAYERALYLEWLCEVALRVLSAGAEPSLLTAGQLAAVAPRLAAYNAHRPAP
jgi:L-fuculose-phosphate aldolase